MSLDQLFISRPSPLLPSCESPFRGLYLCGSGAHPGELVVTLFARNSHLSGLNQLYLATGGGVMGSCGRLAALTALKKK